MFPRSAFIICDLQSRVLNRIPRAKRVVENVNTLITAHQMYTKRDHIKQNPILVAEFMPEKLGPTDQGIMEHLKTSDVLRLNKDTYSVFSGWLDDYFTSQDQNRIVVAGVQSEWCIAQTVRDFARKDYQVDVISDACGSPDPEEHLRAMERLGQLPKVEIFTTHSWIVDKLIDREDDFSKWYVNKLKEKPETEGKIN